MSAADQPKSMLPVAAAIVGMLAGGLSVYWTTRDRMEREIEDRVRIESQVSALAERVKALEGDLWTIKTRNQ